MHQIVIKILSCNFSLSIYIPLFILFKLSLIFLFSFYILLFILFKLSLAYILVKILKTDQHLNPSLLCVYYWDRALASMTWCSSFRFIIYLFMTLISFIILFALIDYMSNHAHITCIIHYLNALLHRISKSRIPHKMISSCSQSVHGFRLFSRDCSVLLLNWRDDLFWPLWWGFHDEWTSLYGYILDMIYNNLWHKLSSSHDSSSSYTTWTFNLERISSLCWNQ